MDTGDNDSEIPIKYMQYTKVIPNKNVTTFSYNTLYIEQNIAFVNLKITLDFAGNILL